MKIYFAGVAAVALVLASCDENVGSWPREPFAEGKWAAAPVGERYVYVRDLLDRRVLDGKAAADVTALLGQPSSMMGERWTYVIKLGGRGFDQVYFIAVQFNAGSVTKVTIGAD